MRKLVGANFILLALLLQVLFLPSTSLAQAPSSGPANFQFSQVDLKLLEEVNEFDHQLSKKGLVLKDPVVTAYVQSIGEELLGDQAPPERVEFKFRVLRDTTIKRPAGCAEWNPRSPASASSSRRPSSSAQCATSPDRPAFSLNSLPVAPAAHSTALSTRTKPAEHPARMPLKQP